MTIGREKRNPEFAPHCSTCCPALLRPTSAFYILKP
jgi:hypothetical protein